MFRNRRRYGGGGGGMNMLALFYLFQQLQAGPIPPVTMGVGGLLTAIHFDFFVPEVIYQYFRINLQYLESVCVNASYVWQYKQWSRLLTAPIVHGGDYHLYWNLSSWIWKGRTLERRYGTQKFLGMTVLLTLLSSVLTIPISYGAAILLDDPSYVTGHCAVGFSATLFALKVVLHRDTPPDTPIGLMGGFIRVPVRWAAWAEIAIIQLIIPQASWIGHAAGIVAGLVYIHFLEAVIEGLGHDGHHWVHDARPPHDPHDHGRQPAHRPDYSSHRPQNEPTYPQAVPTAPPAEAAVPTTDISGQNGRGEGSGTGVSYAGRAIDRSVLLQSAENRLRRRPGR